MERYTRLTFIVGLCALLLAAGSISAQNTILTAIASPNQATLTPTPETCDGESEPSLLGWQLYMSDQPFIHGMFPPTDPPPREVYETGTRRVYAILRTPCGSRWPDVLTISIQIRNRNNGVDFESGPLTVRRNEWSSVEWSVQDNRAIPSGGSPYVTKLFRLDRGQQQHALEG